MDSDLRRETAPPVGWLDSECQRLRERSAELRRQSDETVHKAKAAAEHARDILNAWHY
jgi:hypothetical protein